MSRREFMEQLEELLRDIPQEERIEALAYYNGYFEDAGEENEENIIKELESPEKVAGIIKADMGIEEEKEYTESGYEDTRFHQQEEIGQHTGYRQESAQSANHHMSGDREDKTLKVVLLVLLAIITSPIWLGILSAAAGIILGVFGVVLGVVLAITFTVLALFVAGFVLFGVGISMFGLGNFAAGMGLSGVGFLLLAVAILGTIACVWLFGKFLPWLVKGVIQIFSRLFQRRRNVA